MKKQSIWVFQWRKSVHYWWSYILFSPECKELTSMLDPLLYRWGVPPVVIRCVHWTMQMWVLQTWIKALGLYIVMSCKVALRWMPLDFTDDQSTLVQVKAWCRQVTSHYLSQCWPRFVSPYGVTRPPWVKIQLWNMSYQKPMIQNFNSSVFLALPHKKCYNMIQFPHDLISLQTKWLTWFWKQLNLGCEHIQCLWVPSMNSAPTVPSEQ